MKVEGLIFGILCAVFAALSVIYWAFSQEPTGTTALALSAGLAFLVCFFLLFTGRRLPQRPEDNTEGEVDDVAGIYGFYSPHSWWPLPIGFFAAMTGTGLIIGWWLFYLGALGLLFSLVGLVFEYYIGDNVEA